MGEVSSVVKAAGGPAGRERGMRKMSDGPHVQREGGGGTEMDAGGCGAWKPAPGQRRILKMSDGPHAQRESRWMRSRGATEDAEGVNAFRKGQLCCPYFSKASNDPM